MQIVSLKFKHEFGMRELTRLYSFRQLLSGFYWLVQCEIRLLTQAHISTRTHITRTHNVETFS